MDFSKRYNHNPILSPADLQPHFEGMQIECLLNPGVFEYNGKVWLLLRVAERPPQAPGIVSIPMLDEEGGVKILEFDSEDPDLDVSDPRVVSHRGNDYLTTLSYLRLVCSDNGKNFFEPEGYPPILGEGPAESYGIEDCRVAIIDGVFYLTYTQVSPIGVGVGLMTTQDWKHFERKGTIFPPHNKDCALFEEKINGKYYALHRPSSPSLGGNFIWIAESPDLLHWGNHRCIAMTRPGMWDSARVGAGASPIKTKLGWLAIYHGADEYHRYCLGAILLDINDPSKVLARGQVPIMEPRTDYEKRGFFGNVVFTNGHYLDGERIFVYYGASDEVICMAEFDINDILSLLMVNA